MSIFGLCKPKTAIVLNLEGVVVMIKPFFINFGAVAEWLRRGLQNLVHRFNSGPRLQKIVCPGGGMVDTRDLKSLGGNSVWVRSPPRAP